MMKAILCLAFVCCFVAGALSGKCGCDVGMKSCACRSANKYVMLAKVVGEGKVVEEGPNNNEMVRYQVDEDKAKMYKGDRKKPFSRVIVPTGCETTLEVGVKYLFMGDKADDHKGTLKTRVNNGWIKLLDNLNENQINWLDWLKNDPEAACVGH